MKAPSANGPIDIALQVYKLHDLPTMDGWGEEARRKEIEPILIGAVATKTVAA